MIRAMPIVATDPAQPRGSPALLADGAAGRRPRAHGDRRQRLRGRRSSAERIFDQLIVRTVLPLIALVFGTAALGTELEDGTIVFLLTKPVRRFRIVLAKGVVAAGLTAALIVPATVLTGLVADLTAGLARELHGGLRHRRGRGWDGLRAGLPGPLQLHLAGAGHRPRLRPALGGRPVRALRGHAASSPCGRPPWAWPRCCRGPTSPTRRSADSPPWWSWAPSSWARWRWPRWRLSRYQLRGGD